ncbi:MAG: phosphate starvation-inducible protein PhoH [Verrucomicrobia bacterium]|nr:MAG: phosphate starvation-inducible protein PhoH [Verrucomicrobiota bacterium]
MQKKTLHFSSSRLLSQLYCNNDKNLKHVEKAFHVSLTTREDWLEIEGTEKKIKKVETLFELLDLARSQGINIKNTDFENILKAVLNNEADEMRETFKSPLIIKIRNKSIIPKTINQKRYLQYISKNDIVLSVGPAGTGKTYLAMAAAINALLKNEVGKIILTRPAVEAGEALGFLPGDLTEKILPYLRPLYDAMYDMLGVEETELLLEKHIIEIAPLAYMRGRTLSNAYIILDEAQNTTHEQMMMCLTRLGDGSRMIITGDVSQVDLPKTKISGLKEAIHTLDNIEGIKIFYFENKDVMRHPLVQKIIEAYQQALTTTYNP